MDIRKYFQVTNKNNFFGESININSSNDKIKEKNTGVNKEKSNLDIEKNDNIMINNFKECTNNEFLIFTDGSTFNNHLHPSKRYGGVGVYFEDENIDNISFVLKDCKISNNVAELTAIKMAIESKINHNFDSKQQIKIFSDSKYSIDCFEKYCKQWEKNGWKKYNRGKGSKDIKNIELIKEIWYYYKKYNIRFVHINSHQIEPSDKNSFKYRLWYGNNEADKLAVNASKKSKNKNNI